MTGKGSVLRPVLLDLLDGTYSHAWYNAEGFVVYEPDSLSRWKCYTQFFRFGGLESYSERYAGRSRGTGSSTEFWVERLESDVVRSTKTALRVVREIGGQDPPFALCLGMYGIRGAYVQIGRDMSGQSGALVDVDDVVLPPLIFEEGEPDIEARLQPFFNVFWQSAGYSGK
jgi:hypothetical protein